MFKIIQAFSLAKNTITAELKEYYYWKNDDMTILLLEKYHKYLDMFFKKKFDIIPIYCSYDYTSKINDGYHPLFTMIYGMS